MTKGRSDQKKCYTFSAVGPASERKENLGNSHKDAQKKIGVPDPGRVGEAETLQKSPALVKDGEKKRGDKRAKKKKNHSGHKTEE